MKLPKPRGMTQRPNEDLRWFHQDADAAIGQHGQSLEPSTGGGTPNYEPSKAEQDAAARWRRISRALGELTERQNEILGDCYEWPKINTADEVAKKLWKDLKDDHDAGAGAVLRAWNGSAEVRELDARHRAAKIGQKRELKKRLDSTRTQLARDTMAEVKAAHRDFAAARRRHRAAERELKEQAATPEQRERARELAEQLPSRRAAAGNKRCRPREPAEATKDAATIMADHIRALGAHPFESVRAARAELPKELRGETA